MSEVPLSLRVVLIGTRTATSSRFSRSAIMNGVELVHGASLGRARGTGDFRAAICCITRLQPHLSQHGWPLVLPRCCGLISGRRAQYGGVVTLPTNNL